MSLSSFKPEHDSEGVLDMDDINHDVAKKGHCIHHDGTVTIRMDMGIPVQLKEFSKNLKDKGQSVSF